MLYDNDITIRTMFWFDYNGFYCSICTLCRTTQTSFLKSDNEKFVRAQRATDKEFLKFIKDVSPEEM